VLDPARLLPDPRISGRSTARSARRRSPGRSVRVDAGIGAAVGASSRASRAVMRLQRICRAATSAIAGRSSQGEGYLWALWLDFDDQSLIEHSEGKRLYV
jgi:hypothetical protein